MSSEKYESGLSEVAERVETVAGDLWNFIWTHPPVAFGAGVFSVILLLGFGEHMANRSWRRD